MTRPSGGSASAVASGSVAPGRRVTRSAITVVRTSAEGPPQVGLHTAGIDVRRELFEHAGDELLAGVRIRGAALRDDPRNRSQRGKRVRRPPCRHHPRASARRWRSRRRLARVALGIADGGCARPRYWCAARRPWPGSARALRNRRSRRRRPGALPPARSPRARRGAPAREPPRRHAGPVRVRPPPAPRCPIRWARGPKAGWCRAATSRAPGSIRRRAARRRVGRSRIRRRAMPGEPRSFGDGRLRLQAFVPGGSRMSAGKHLRQRLRWRAPAAPFASPWRSDSAAPDPSPAPGRAPHRTARARRRSSTSLSGLCGS